MSALSLQQDLKFESVIACEVCGVIGVVIVVVVVFVVVAVAVVMSVSASCCSKPCYPPLCNLHKGNTVPCRS